MGNENLKATLELKTKTTIWLTVAKYVFKAIGWVPLARGYSNDKKIFTVTVKDVLANANKLADAKR